MKYNFTFRLFNRFTLAALLASLIGSAVSVTPVYAASIVVNSAADTIANDGVCTLREALEAAQANFAQNGCPGGSAVGADTITFAGNYTITLSSQLPTIVTAVMIQGKGAANTIIQAAASPNVATWRVFQVHTTGSLTLDGVTVRNGRCNGSCTVLGGIFPNGGGGIYNSGILTVTNSTISGNSAEFGSIFNSGTLTVTNSTLSNNVTSTSGGGIYNEGTLILTNNTFSGNSAIYGGGIYSNGTLTVTNSTFSGNNASSGGGGIRSSGSSSNTVTGSTFVGNSAGYGGAIYPLGNLTVTNSTIVSNTASSSGGGIFTRGTLIVTNSTIVGNTAVDGAGITRANPGGTTTLKNTIVTNSGENCFGTITNGGNNLDSGATCGWGTSSGSMSNTDPKLGSLADNGGPTQTMALLASSSAIDAIPVVNGSCNDTGVTKDQRGMSRPQGAGCDIGAYEYNGTFFDVPLDYWAWDFIERLYAAGITGGCNNNPLRYCSETVVTRAQMAIFLERGIHGSSYNPPAVGISTGFNDVSATYWAAAWIKQLAAEGITGGCGIGLYCPEGAVTRAQMSVFLLRSKHGASYAPPAAGGSTGFTDVPTSYWAAAWIKQLVAEGITSGCGSGTYCPESPVTRAQMAVFLVRTFNLP